MWPPLMDHVTDHVTDSTYFSPQGAQGSPGNTGPSGPPGAAVSIVVFFLIFKNRCTYILPTSEQRTCVLEPLNKGRHVQTVQSSEDQNSIMEATLFKAY